MRSPRRGCARSPTRHEVWLRFQGYTKLIILGQGGPKADPAAKPAA